MGTNIKRRKGKRKMTKDSKHTNKQPIQKATTTDKKKTNNSNKKTAITQTQQHV